MPSSSELIAPYSSNAGATVAQQYPNQGYHSSYQEQSVISDPRYSFPPPTLVSNSGEVGVTVDKTYMHNSTKSSALASGYQYQGYPAPSYYQAASQTTDQLVSNAPALVSDTHATYYWVNAPSDHMIEQYQITQATVVGASEHQIPSYTNVPVYSAGANPTY